MSARKQTQACSELLTSEHQPQTTTQTTNKTRTKTKDFRGETVKHQTSAVSSESSLCCMQCDQQLRHLPLLSTRHVPKTVTSKVFSPAIQLATDDKQCGHLRKRSSASEHNAYEDSCTMLADAILLPTRGEVGGKYLACRRRQTMI